MIALMAIEIEESWDDDWEEDEYGYDADDESYTVECPECGADVYEDAEQCPVCHNYIVHSSSGYVWKNRPTWWIVVGLLGILAVILGLSLVPL